MRAIAWSKSGPGGTKGVGAPPVQWVLPVRLDGACTQLTDVTKQTGLVEGVVSNLSLTGVLGGLLNIPALPTPLGAFSCP